MNIVQKEFFDELTRIRKNSIGNKDISLTKCFDVKGSFIELKDGLEERIIFEGIFEFKTSKGDYRNDKDNKKVILDAQYIFAPYSISGLGVDDHGEFKVSGSLYGSQLTFTKDYINDDNNDTQKKHPTISYKLSEDLANKDRFEGFYQITGKEEKPLADLVIISKN